MKPTKQERKEIYQLAKRIVESTKSYGLCLSLYNAYKLKTNRHMYFGDVLAYFAEFAMFKPEGVNPEELWFENDFERLIVLDLCIEMLNVKK